MSNAVSSATSPAQIVGRVASVNVGLPRDVAWKGGTVRTSIWKSPIAGRVRASRLHLEGDRQADLVSHGGEQRAMMVYQTDSYRFWSELLGRSDLVPGQFGENLTVDGLADSDVCIGDRYRIGTVIAEVSQPRVTCFKVGIRLGVPDMPALLVKHKRPGFYLRVLQEGDIGAGDEIEKLSIGREQLSVTVIDGLLYGSKHPRDDLERASQIPALSQGWRRSFQSLLASTEDGVPSGNAGLIRQPRPLHWPGFRPLKVVATIQESEDVRSFELAAPDGAPLPDGLPGQHVLLRLTGTDGKPLIRNYSLCGAPGAGTYLIGVKKEGLLSQRLHAEVHEDTVIDVSAPRGNFILEPAETPAVLVSAGIGITPVLSMLLAATQPNARLRRQLWWIHSARDGAHDAFRSAQSSRLKRLDPKHVRTVYSRPRPSADILGVDYSQAGHLDGTFFRSLSFPSMAEYYLCGPTTFMNDVKHALAAIGVPKDSVYQETFGVVATGSARPPHVPPAPVGDGPAISFAQSGLSVPWNTRYGSLLEFAEACDVPVRWSCRSGVCHLCESTLLEGRFRYEPDPIETPPTGRLLLCCSRPLGPMVIDL